MSTEIKTITGRYEESSNGGTANYADSDISLTRFWGGKNGSMIQVTISNNQCHAYSQLTKKQVKNLIKTLKKSFDINPH